MQPRKLNLREIHRLYLLLKPFLPKEEEKFLIDETEKMLRKMSPADFAESMRFFYPKDKGTRTEIELLVMFMEGLKENDFFSYAHFINNLNGSK